jgi:ABC-2 type transport system permease protein
MSLRKYRTILAISMRNQLQYLPAYLSRNLFFLIIMFIFSSLWRVVFAENPVIAGFTMTQTLWYLTITETVELARASGYVEIQEEVKDGTIAYALLRPYSYAFFKIPRFVGESLVKIGPILAEGFLVAWLFSGMLPGYFRAIPLGIVLIIGGIILNTLWQTTIGLLAFWTEEVAPFYWIVQKLLFVLGGLFFPIDFFPDRLASISKLLPFAFAAYWPARTVVAFSWEAFATALLGQLGYIALFSALLALVFRRAKRRVHVQGG